MKLAAKFRLMTSPWALHAMPQIVPEELDLRWFDDFGELRADLKLFEYSKHEVWGYKHPGYPGTKFFVALDQQGKPVYINEVTLMDVDFGPEASKLKSALHGKLVWKQSSVAFHKDADRGALKGLATKIFWDYLATKNNVAVTDSQQTLSGASFWRKLLNTGSGYLVALVDDTYRTDYIKVVSGGDRFEDANHFQYDAKQLWKESNDGKLIRVFIRRDL
jgi:hypothetical protein